VWGDDLPDTRARAVAFQISKLIDILEPERVGEGSVINTSTAGYVLHVERDSVDVHRFDRLLDDARVALASDPPRCQVLIDEASALWRGRPFADLGDEPFVAAEVRRLDQRYLVAQRTRIEVALALGRHVDVVGDLKAMVSEHSTEESVVQMLMVALQRSGRTADALRVFGEFRMRLSHELGIDPSRDLQAFEAKLLAGGPETVYGSQLEHRRPQSVPAAATSLVGRNSELVEIVEVLSSARPVTLCGFGGLGKARLAQEITRSEADRFADGVWFVDLTSIDDAGLLVNTFLASRWPSWRMVVTRSIGSWDIWWIERCWS
jgi:DNA-binding SARP family transcriptional activator